MTVLTQYRLECNYCGNISPPIPRIPHQFSEHWPANWLTHNEFDCRPCPQPPYYQARQLNMHFCCTAHYQAWMRKREDDES